MVDVLRGQRRGLGTRGELGIGTGNGCRHQGEVIKVKGPPSWFRDTDDYTGRHEFIKSQQPIRALHYIWPEGADKTTQLGKDDTFRGKPTVKKD